MRQETIENYLKTIYNLSADTRAAVGNFQLADKLGIRPASVTEALQKLHELKFVVYEKSYGTRLTAQGSRLALEIVRRHRIWETYLARVLGFGWDEVHEIAEELEHIKNDKLINKLSELLGNPSYDPHGDPIPDAKLKIRKGNFISLSDGRPGRSYVISGVTDHSTVFLKYLERTGLVIGAELFLRSVEAYDGSLVISLENRDRTITQKAGQSIVVAAK